jgi:hypothetical protein
MVNRVACSADFAPINETGDALRRPYEPICSSANRCLL